VSADLERDLRALGDELAWPDTPDIAARLELPARARGTRKRRWLLAAAAAVAVLVPAGAAVGDDVLRWLGLASVQVERRPHLPPAVAAKLGPQVDASEAPYVPPTLGPPREVRRQGDVITLVYDHVLLAETRGSIRKIATDVERVPEGLWFARDHAYAYLTPDGDFRSARPWRAGPALVAQRGDLVLRLEGPHLTRDRAREILR
jgi:hypothetical protein